jgi:hypothetical protein
MHGPKGEGLALAARTLPYLARWTDENLFYAAAAGLGFLLVRGRRRAAGVVVLALAAICLVIVNCRYWFLPGSALLYPERAAYWGPPLAALCLGLALRAAPRGGRGWRLAATGAGAALLVIAAARHVQYFQRIALGPAISDPAWSALKWAGSGLDPMRTLVHAAYDGAGSYLPAVAGVHVRTSRSHLPQVQQAEEPPAERMGTHVFWEDYEPSTRRRMTREKYEAAYGSLRQLAERYGTVVFESGTVRICRLPEPGSRKAAPAATRRGP